MESEQIYLHCNPTHLPCIQVTEEIAVFIRKLINETLLLFTNIYQCLHEYMFVMKLFIYYNPATYAEGYIVFVFPFVLSSVRIIYRKVA